MKKFIVRVNCVSFEDIEVEAETEEEAISEARNQFVCPQNGNEFGEIIYE